MTAPANDKTATVSGEAANDKTTSEVREPTIADLTTDVISELIRRERETKRAAKRERWANHLV